MNINHFKFAAFGASLVMAVAASRSMAMDVVQVAYERENVSAFEVNSAVLGRKVRVELYQGPYDTDDDMTVTYVTDGASLGAASYMSDLGREVDRGEGRIRPTLTVAIDYTHQQMQEGEAECLRVLDLTYVLDPEEENLECQGGAEKFLKFINTEIKPLVYAVYPNVDRDNEILVGHSLGGLFALYTLLTQPDSFDRYMIISPSIWWAGGHIFSLEADYAKSHPYLNKALHFGVGSEEGTMVTDMQTMIQRLSDRQYPQLKILQGVYQGVGHLGAPQYSLTLGKGALLNDTLLNTPAWNTSKAYRGGDRVNYQGKIYQARWWNQSARPEASNSESVWTLVRSF